MNEIDLLSEYEINRIFNSIGSNIFIEFGQEKEVVFPNETKDVQKEWVIWISHASWRITKREKFLVGSGDDPETIQSSIQELLGKCFKNLRVLSNYLDVEFNFDGEYQLTTFFNWSEANQWTIFFPNQSEIEINCSSAESIKHTQSLSRNYKIDERFGDIDLPQLNEEAIVEKIIPLKMNSFTLLLNNNISIELSGCVWRIEKSNDYLVGSLDENEGELLNSLEKLVGMKLKKIEVANSMMDARFQFDDQYVLQIFTCFKSGNQMKFLTT